VREWFADQNKAVLNQSFQENSHATKGVVSRIGAARERGGAARCVVIVFFALFMVWTDTAMSEDADAALASAAKLRDAGQFKEAADSYNAISHSQAFNEAQRRQAAVQRDMLKRIREDYSLSQSELFEKLTKSVKGLTREEFGKWVAENRFDELKIDGTNYFLGVSVANLFFRHPDLNARRINGKDTLGEQRGRLEVARAIKKAALAQHSPYVLPHRFRCTMTVTADKDAAPDGETIRAWLPVPRLYPFQNDFKLLTSSPPAKSTASETSPIRAVYMEEAAKAGQPTRFEIAYTYTASGVHFALDPTTVGAIDASDPTLKPFLKEAPHVVFTPQIKALAAEIAGNQSNPMLVARSFYEWIAGNIQYSFAREYSTLTNISDYCLGHRYGDCGQEALLFITLCRSRGIPARWQTGWNTFPGAKDIHDWTEIYLPPYGWVPVDPWAGIYATQYCPSLTDAEREELRSFYFGGLDYYRMAANGDHSQTLDPPKNTVRSDDVDFQRGELEWRGGNIYFDRYSYEWTAEELIDSP
jgi:transglutaminase-like putative cysteine protease/transcriptional regulator with XRE-family HTH domain